MTPQQIDELEAVLEPIKDLQNAVLELNDALRLDVPEIDTTKSELVKNMDWIINFLSYLITYALFFVDEEEDQSEYESLFASDLGVSIVTEAIRQMAEMRLVTC